MDDLIVLILTVIILVLGVIAQTKKKKPMQTDASQNNSSGSFWDLLQGETEFIPQQPENVPPAEPVPTKTEPKESKYKFTPSNEGRAGVMKEVVENREVKKKEKILDENFSLRKAIIYSEIINRKYT